MKIYIGSDHAGFHLKSELLEFLKKHSFDVVDCGPTSYVPDDDYPDYVSKVASHISESKTDKGIVIGLSGEGEAMVCNRFPDVRCAVFYGGSQHIVTLSRQHNDANILSLGAQFLTSGEAQKAVLLWLHTDFSGEEKHLRRIKKIEEYD